METGLERARRLIICPPGEIASVTSSFELPFCGTSAALIRRDFFGLLDRDLHLRSAGSLCTGSPSESRSSMIPQSSSESSGSRMRNRFIVSACFLTNASVSALLFGWGVKRGAGRGARRWKAIPDEGPGFGAEILRGVHVVDGTGRKGVEKSPLPDCADLRLVPTPTRCAGCELSCFAANMVRWESLTGVSSG
jgi:hypothetical protein